MLRWRKVEAGEYVSEERRFRATKVYDRVYGDHWVLRDLADETDSVGYHYDTLLECKVKAEYINEQR